MISQDNGSMWFFIRHAESTANLAKILGGQGDYPLTKAGHNQARLVAGEMLKQLPAIEQIISSPQSRAQQSAEEIALVLGIKPADISYEEALMEQNIGRFTGMDYQQAQNDPGYQADVAQRWHWRPEGGESYAEIAKRVECLLYRYQRQGKRKLLFVTHAVTMRLIHGILSNSLPKYPSTITENGEIWQCALQSLGQVHPIIVHKFPGITPHRP